MKLTQTMTLLFLLAMAGSGGPAAAAAAPDLINYQGVLRDNMDDPLNGPHDMAFRLYETDGGVSCVGGDLLLTDTHEGAGAVEVTGGMFNVHVGSGTITPGLKNTLAEAFRDYDAVWLEVEVEGQVLCPRIRVVAAAYSLNAAKLDGRDPAEYIDISAANQIKAGNLTINELELSGGEIVSLLGARIQDTGDGLRISSGTEDSDSLNLNAGNDLSDGGIRIHGDSTAELWSRNGNFDFISGASGLVTGTLNAGNMQLSGSLTAGFFTGDGSGLTNLSADSLDSLDSTQFLRSDAGDTFTTGTLTFSGGTRLAVDSGTEAAPGLHVADNPATGIFSPSTNQLAITTAGTKALHLYSNGDAVLGGRLFPGGTTTEYLTWSDGNARFEFSGDAHTEGDAFLDGGLFPGGSTTESLSWVEAEHRFEFSDDVYASNGMYASTFYDKADTNYYVDPDNASYLNQLRLQNSAPLYLNYGGPDMSVTFYFHDGGSDSGEAFRWDDAGDEFELTNDLHISGAVYGVEAFGTTAGGYFHDDDSSGYGYVGYGNDGGNFSGSSKGARGYDQDSGVYGYLGYSTSSTHGNGAKNFVQNHPENDDQVIVYTAPEGNEVATYTRGTARLADGEARVVLDDTFAWVTNPDIGLTAHLTPRGQEAVLYIASLTTREMVVRSAADSPANAVFDYMVWGLRIGFEETGVVQEKGDEEARIPSMAAHREARQKHPEWDRHLAMERFSRMQLEIGETGPLDLTASLALRDAVEEYDPAVHGAGDPLSHTEVLDPGEKVEVAPDVEARPEADPEGTLGGPATATFPMDAEGNIYAKSFRPSAGDLASLVAVSQPVVAGDVLVIDPKRPGLLALAREASDTAVFGIVAGTPGVVLGAKPPSDETIENRHEGREVAQTEVNPSLPEDDSVVLQAPVAVSGIAQCKVDAAYGAIRPGDLLTTSATPGHAMLAHDPQPGTILGKALEPLDSGTGSIKVLVMLR